MGWDASPANAFSSTTAPYLELNIRSLGIAADGEVVAVVAPAAQESKPTPVDMKMYTLKQPAEERTPVVATVKLTWSPAKR